MPDTFNKTLFQKLSSCVDSPSIMEDARRMLTKEQFMDIARIAIEWTALGDEAFVKAHIDMYDKMYDGDDSVYDAMYGRLVEAKKMNVTREQLDKVAQRLFSQN